MCVLSVLNVFKGASCFAQKSQLSPLLSINKEVCFSRQGAI